MQAAHVIKRYVPACLTIAKTGAGAVVPAPGLLSEDLRDPDLGRKEGRKGKVLNRNTVRAGIIKLRARALELLLRVKSGTQVFFLS